MDEVSLRDMGPLKKLLSCIMGSVGLSVFGACFSFADLLKLCGLWANNKPQLFYCCSSVTQPTVVYQSGLKE